MPAIFTVTSNDTLTLNGRVMVDLALDDVTNISFPNELVSRKTGKNGNTIFAQNQQGLNADLTLRLSRGSADDQYMQGLITANIGDFPSTQLLAGSFVKRLGDGQGNVLNDVYSLNGGVVAKIPDGKENVSGDVQQGESIYMIKFANALRIIQ